MLTTDVWLVMSFSKYQSSAALKRKCLSLDEKIVILDYVNEHPKMGCPKIAENFSVGKTTVSNILKDGKNLRDDFEFFKGNYKKRRRGKCHVINETLYNWYRKCTSANVYPDWPLLQEEAMGIKRRPKKEKFTGFTASNGWLDSWKQTYGLRENRFGSNDYWSCFRSISHATY